MGFGVTSASERWYGAEMAEETPWGLSSPSATYFNSPGSVENYLSWIGATSEGSRGSAETRETPASVQITGEAEVLRNLSRILSAAPKKALARLEQNCEFILSESQKEVPVDMSYTTRTVSVSRSVPSSGQWYGAVGTEKSVLKRVTGRMKGGHLLETGTVESAPEINGFRIGYNTPYAARQHEDMTFHHTRPGAKAKYLEDPAMRIGPTIAADIADALREYLG